MNDMMKSLRDSNVEKSDMRIMVVGAHPDDADNLAGGTAIKFARAGARVRFVSACNGDKGHHEMSCQGLAARRKAEAARAAAVFGIERYDVMDTPDCIIEPDIAQRDKFTRLIREFAPHLIFTHRLCDYHADHRATSQIVQDVAYMLGVPRWCADVPIPDVKPAIFFLSDDIPFAPMPSSRSMTSWIRCWMPCGNMFRSFSNGFRSTCKCRRTMCRTGRTRRPRARSSTGGGVR